MCKEKNLSFTSYMTSFHFADFAFIVCKFSVCFPFQILMLRQCFWMHNKLVAIFITNSLKHILHTHIHTITSACVCVCECLHAWVCESKCERESNLIVFFLLQLMSSICSLVTIMTNQMVIDKANSNAFTRVRHQSLITCYMSGGTISFFPFFSLGLLNWFVGTAWKSACHYAIECV